MADFETIEKIQRVIEGLLKVMDLEATVSPEDSIQRGLVFNISTPDSYLLIGKQGATLYALQAVAQVMVRKALQTAEPVYFSIDVDDYRRKREWYLKEATKNAVEKVKLSGRPVVMEPMTSTERRFVHSYIQEHYSEIHTTSEGVDPYRKIVVNLKKLQ